MRVNFVLLEVVLSPVHMYVSDRGSFAAFAVLLEQVHRCPHDCPPIAAMVKSSSVNQSTKVASKKKCRFNLAHVIKHIPKGKRTKNNKENNHTQVLRSALVRVLKRFESDEESIMRVDGVLQADLVSAAETNANDNDYWPSSYVKLYRLSSRWKGALLVKASRGEISVSLLKALLRKDDQVVESMFSLFTQTTDKTYLPRMCLDKRVCEIFFLRRIEQCGNRWSGWAKLAVKNDTVQWAKGGAYRLHWENERATKIAHVSGAMVDLPAHSVVGPEFEFKFPPTATTPPSSSPPTASPASTSRNCFPKELGLMCMPSPRTTRRRRRSALTPSWRRPWCRKPKRRSVRSRRRRRRIKRRTRATNSRLRTCSPSLSMK